MKCETDGNPQPQFEFTGNVRAHLGPSAQCSFICVLILLLLILYVIFKQDMSHTSETGLYVLRNVTRNDSGTYKCEAMDFDAVGELTKTLTINVHCEYLVNIFNIFNNL